ncbi:hypothetical protein S83_066493, partial [Arachis hypogaea]
MLLRLTHELPSDKTYQLRRALMMVAVPLVLITIVLYVLPSISSNESIEDYTLTHRRISPDNRASSFYAVFFDVGSHIHIPRRSQSRPYSHWQRSRAIHSEFKALCSLEIDEIVQTLLASDNAELKGIMKSLVVIARNQGWKQLFSGLSINYIKVVSSVAIGFTVYDTMKSYLRVPSRDDAAVEVVTFCLGKTEDVWTDKVVESATKACGDRVLRELHEWEQHKKGYGHGK